MPLKHDGLHHKCSLAAVLIVPEPLNHFQPFIYVRLTWSQLAKEPDASVVQFLKLPVATLGRTEG